MKKFLQHINVNLTLLAIGILFNACTKDDEQPHYIPEGDYISLYSTITPKASRLLTNNFEVNESIGLYVIPYEAENTPGSISNTAYAANKEHIFNGDSWLLKSGGKVAWPDTISKVDLYAYYPYSEALDKQQPTSYRFSVKSDQQNKANYDASDFLWAQNKGIIPTANAVGLIFSHTFSKVKVNVRSELDIISNALPSASVTILNVKQEGNINLSDGTVFVAEDSPLANINPLHVQTTEEYKLTREAIIIPQTAEKGNPFIRVELNLNDTRYDYILTDDIRFEAGKERSINIVITRMGLSVTIDKIKDWEPTLPIEGDIGTFAPQVLDLNSIDWEKSLVHTVFNKGIPIAEVTKEYIYKNGTVDYQAIVVYPMGIDGKPDLTKGFIARAMNRNRNSITNEYEPNNNEIHGGVVSFSTSDNTLQSYTKGTATLFDKVEIVSKDEIKIANENAIPILTTSPEVLTDIDGNTYPIVKIGVQYWIRENLKVEHFKDGSGLAYYYYDDNKDNKDRYGAYYTWATAMDSKGIAPDGWRVPSSADFISLHAYIQPDAGMKLKANIMWNSLSYNDDVTGFSGLPTGRRTNTGTYNELGYYGQWWTSTISGTSDAYRLYLYYSNRAMHHYTLNQNYTQSVRLIRE
ncbi:MAG: fimbrillin family protein [Prevotellaceae bacterium]|jgi:uncharacterized protein (TIGR02145 family)|nr:fimbrillin family protein [Prevotellaceae bacterium]